MNDTLSGQLRQLDGEELLRAAIEGYFPGSIAVLSSFGAQSAVMLDMVAGIAPATPVIFLDTGMLFPQTLEYVELLRRRLGLTDIRAIRPTPADVDHTDPDGRLHETDADACCDLRKVRPMFSALRGFDAWITGRRRSHGEGRANLPGVEATGGRLRINPLAGWSDERIKDAFVRRRLPPHPLTAEGYSSLGCRPCTRKTVCNENIRAGRWPGSAKTECGIHDHFQPTRDLKQCIQGK